MVLVGSCPGGNSPIGIVVPVGNGWALFLSGGELSLVGSCPARSCTCPCTPYSYIVCKSMVHASLMFDHQQYIPSLH